MAMTRTEAADALRDVERTTERAHRMRGYSHASPHLLLWGAVWAAGYVAMSALPQAQWGWMWLGLDFAGMAGSVLLGVHGHRGTALGTERRAETGPVFAIILFVSLFAIAVFVLFQPRAVAPYLVFPGLVLGLVYVVAGAWRMHRLAWIGAGVFALSMAGYWLARDALAFWMAAVGGGGLILGGLWLRRA